MRRRHALLEALTLAEPEGHVRELQTRAPTSQQLAALARIAAKMVAC